MLRFIVKPWQDNFISVTGDRRALRALRSYSKKAQKYIYISQSGLLTLLFGSELQYLYNSSTGLRHCAKTIFIFYISPTIISCYFFRSTNGSINQSTLVKFLAQSTRSYSRLPILYRHRKELINTRKTLFSSWKGERRKESDGAALPACLSRSA